MQFEKKSVRLGDIRPSEQNPREDFGDIGALARSIEATGGEPLNPPVVVADGNVYRIVDGERRYRALSSIYGEDREVSALVADTMDEANELVAMLATDDKRQLTEAERARNLKACKPNEYEAGCWLMAAAKDMAQLNNRWGVDDAEAWLDHYDIFCFAGFEPGEEDVWLMERVQASFKEEKDE